MISFDRLRFIHQHSVQAVPTAFKRHLYDRIDWEEGCLCLTGARGVGKTTLLLQHYHERYGSVEDCLYLSADNVEVESAGLFNAASEHFKYGGKALIIDEIHKRPSWQSELKSIIDTFKGKKILVSGSSSLGLKKGKADLSRRLAYYDLRGLSFREYLKLKEGLDLPALSLDGILRDHVRHAQKACGGSAVLRSFQRYLASGYYPFFVEGETLYLQKVLNSIEKALYEDAASAGNLKQSGVRSLKKILWVIATSPPFTTNIEKMSRELGISKVCVYDYLDYLADAGLILGLREAASGFKLARKPEKLYIENTNLLHALAGSMRSEAEQGAVRETFFANQTKGRCALAPEQGGDFILDGKIRVEVGGRSKGFAQVHGAPGSVVAADGIEVGAGRKIPLYLFGFLY